VRFKNFKKEAQPLFWEVELPKFSNLSMTAEEWVM